MKDLLRAASELYGDSHMEPKSGKIYVGGVLATAMQQMAIERKATELEIEYNNTEYSRLRRAAYRKLNQDEMRFDDLINGTTTWRDAILDIRAQYPDPKKVGGPPE